MLNHVKGSFFLTGDYMRNPAFKPYVQQMLHDGHMVSGHSDKHLLVSDWTHRDKLLVGQDSFVSDLSNNLRELEALGIHTDHLRYYIPSYEWYNRQTVAWAKDMGLLSVNYTPGLRTAADYTYPEMGKRYLSSVAIMEQLWSYESRFGLRGFLILIHMGTDPRRQDKLYHHLDDMIKRLKEKGYRFVDVPDLMK